MSRYVMQPQYNGMGFLPPMPPPSSWPIIGPLIPEPPKSSRRPPPTRTQPKAPVQSAPAPAPAWEPADILPSAGGGPLAMVKNNMPLAIGGAAAIGIGLFILMRRKKK